MSSENNNNNNNVWQFPEQESTSLVGDEVPVYVVESSELEPVPKRWKPSSSSSSSSYPMDTQQPRLDNELSDPQPEYNPLNELSPLGLRLRKSPSLVELAQKRLDECHSDKGGSPVEDLEVENLEAEIKKDVKAKARTKASSSIDKLKASHFPASILRIGRWEYVSKHEGDLVAKCYFSKHKIVWEVLDSGLKKKFEINWADIMALKANYAANGPGSLIIVIDKPPAFFKEINPQPRKHTQWRTTADFTDGEAMTERQHFLQCEQGVLDKHYEKLINSDPRLNFLSRQPDIVLNVPFFPSETINEQDMSGNNVLNQPEFYDISHMASPSNFLAYTSGSMESVPLGLIHQDKSKEGQSSSSGMSMDIDVPNDMKHLYAPGLQPNMSISDLVNHIGNSLFEQNVSMNVPFSNNAPGPGYPKDMLENISQILLSDNQLTTASDERILMSRVNSLCCLLQDYQNGQQIVNDNSTPHHNPIPHQVQNESFTLHHNLNPHQGRNDSFTPHHNLISHHDIFTPHHDPISYQGRNDSFTPESFLMPVNTTQTHSQIISATPSSSQMTQQDENGNLNPETNQESGIARNDSFAELVHHLPRIASLPRFMFDISENGEILK